MHKTLLTDSQAVRADALGKCYRHTPERYGSTLRESISSLWNSRQRQEQKGDFWALKDVSFAMDRGEILGILGRNGAGKSTLLKIISRITRPTTGSVQVRGRVGSLLEVGTGFHPELTGRENVFLSGAVLGMKREEIVRKFDRIVQFAEMGEFLDLPVKRYSSGMYVRLAFSVVAHLDPDILIVDEVLAVGDAVFQKKCLDRLREMVHEGSTIMLVSHNINAVMSLCTRAILLEKGEVAASGNVFDCVNRYARTRSGAGQRVWTGDLGDESLRLYGARLVSCEGREVLQRGDRFYLEFEYEVLTERSSFVVVGADFFASTGIFLCGSRLTDFAGQMGTAQLPGRHLARLEVDTSLFAEGDYLIKLNLGLHNLKRVIEDEPQLFFSVVNPDRNYDHETPIYRNMVYPNWRWTLAE